MSLSCEVCYETYSVQRPAHLIIECGHDFCGICLLKLLAEHRSRAQCPKCRVFLIPQENARDVLRLLMREVYTSMEGLGNSPMFKSLFPRCCSLSDLSTRLIFRSEELTPEMLTQLLACVDTSVLANELGTRSQERSSSSKSTSNLTGYQKLSRSSPTAATDVSFPFTTKRRLGAGTLWTALMRLPAGKPTPDARQFPKQRQNTITPSREEYRDPGIGSLMLILVYCVFQVLEQLLWRLPVRGAFWLGSTIKAQCKLERLTQILAMLHGLPLFIVAVCCIVRAVMY
eukprot:Protomagalhaensia_sp_Gyna_25__2392@NODE_2327_length_1145_cov_96_771248_g1930_i0_p1_GENE_NODE_2327_length_1145_cov_96_771248_g1930_i0NODE_2327_length_1145_cov_96_771248_g1930_i0_p1_ORF_typecomplete_len286_score14_92zfRING_5/PF14634_6/9_6e08zfC3HC4/PF00097_25/3_2e06zfC3HC4_2/PF13923_6/3_5e06zfRING_2/PF13639_6/6_7e06zfC3HC4_4/PF15227_6/0_0001zfANAPC11/PF12861_7/0_00018zfRING_UBOX/PF13445_6/0_00044ProkRING_4/PF14447_6/0_0011zfRING_4/PF14570_6/0_003Baculo_IE1/PF05290_11/0_032zfC3HC4_5/PF17121_5/0_2zf